MTMAICSIQRNRAPWIKEWVAFHYAVGFRKFYIFLHRCSDNSAEVVLNLARFFDIEVFSVPDDAVRPQLLAYSYCYQQYGSRHDWIAFIDGDEFLFSPEGIDLSFRLEPYLNQPIGALGVFWVCFGSSGHIKEPDGLVVENYRRRAGLDFDANRHFKSIVKGRLGKGFSIGQNSHWFLTEGGTFDLLGRKLEHGLVDFPPFHHGLRINHYVTQSREFYEQFKKLSGAADAGSQMVRSEEWWTRHDHNDHWDESLVHLRESLLKALDTCS